MKKIKLTTANSIQKVSCLDNSNYITAYCSYCFYSINYHQYYWFS